MLEGHVVVIAIAQHCKGNDGCNFNSTGGAMLLGSGVTASLVRALVAGSIPVPLLWLFWGMHMVCGW